MLFRRLVLLFAAFTAALMSGVGLSAAQGNANSLRDLADQSHFYIGAAASTSHLDDSGYAETLSREFNMLTPENEAKFCELQAVQNEFDFRDFDQLVDLAAQHKMVVRGHNLVWHQCVPSWLENGKFTQQEAIEIMRDHIMTVMGRYRGRVPIWDVVNEAETDDGSGLRDSVWKRLISDNYVEMAFRFAHEADPNALLFYNDYSAEAMNPKSDAVYAMMQDFVKRGVPVNGVGLQTHITVGDTQAGKYADAQGIDQNMKRLAALGLQVQITEMDVKHEGDPTDAVMLQQASDYRNVLNVCLNNKNCTAFITWGVSDQYSWLRGAKYYDNPKVAPLLFDDNYKPKKAYFAIQDLLARHAGDKPLLSDSEVATMMATP